MEPLLRDKAVRILVLFWLKWLATLEEDEMPMNHNGGGQGPWGQGPQPQPPDMEKVIQMARERFGGKVPDGKKIWSLLILVVLLVWMGFSSLYIVGPDEQGVVIRFGKFVDTTGPGLHFKLPYPIENVYRPKVTQVQRIEIGYRTRGRNSVDVEAESLMLTGDENIIDIDLSVQYRIKDAANFLFNVRNPPRDPHLVVRNATESAIRQVVGRNSIDEALTTGKEKIQNATKTTMQATLDAYKSGIQIMAVQLQQVAPPQEVVKAFKDVASAREDRERTINESQGYANDILPKAKGEAAQQIQQAEGYKASKVARAEGDVNRFLALLTEYNKAKHVTWTRLYLETMEEVLADVNKVIISPNSSNGLLPLMPVGQQATGLPGFVGKGGVR
ncbi:MAG: FtsH protease activity modulator HflK [Magnetococcales bacterium]|nr:FtsH protease activity modulator HflK [Magnetococcales bacterium]